MDGPEPHIDRRFFVEANPQNLQALRPFIRQRGTEPLPAALEVMGAPVVPQNEFRMLDSRYEARELPARRIRAHFQSLLGNWHSVGPQGGAAAANYLPSAEGTHSTMGRSPFAN